VETAVVDYDALVRAYNDNLFTVLRGFKAGSEFLETWVPDQDDVKSVLCMFEAAHGSRLPELTVRVGLETGKRLSLSLPRLRALAAGLGELEVRTDEHGTDLKLRFVEGARAAAPRVAAAPVVRAPAPAPERTTGDSPRDGSLPACYRERVAALASAPAHEGPAPEEVGTVLVEAPVGEAILAVAITPGTNVTRRAAYRGAKTVESRGLLEGLCSILEGKPLVEASDHAAIRLENHLRDAGAQRPVSGITMPENASSVFRPLIAAVREILRLYEARAGKLSVENTFDPRPSAAWLRLSDRERRERLDVAFAETGAELGLAPGSVACERIDRETRVTVRFSPTANAAAKPRLLMALESGARSRVDPALRLYVTELTDLNRMRRLSEESAGRS
jgi:hypothetical protein